MVQIEGKYKLDKSDNFDAFLKEMGIGVLKRTAAKSATPTLEISVNGDEYVIKTISAIKTSEIKFKLGQEFEETRADDKTVKTVINKEGDNKLVQVQHDDKPVHIVREFSDQGITVTATVNGVTSVRFYKRL